MQGEQLAQELSDFNNKHNQIQLRKQTTQQLLKKEQEIDKKLVVYQNLLDANPIDSDENSDDDVAQKNNLNPGRNESMTGEIFFCGSIFSFDF